MNFSVRLFSVTVRTTFSGVPASIVRFDFESDFHRRSHQPGEMRNHLVGDAPRIAPDTSGIETDAAVEPLGPARRSRSGSACTAGRNRSGRSATTPPVGSANPLGRGAISAWCCLSATSGAPAGPKGCLPRCSPSGRNADRDSGPLHRRNFRHRRTESWLHVSNRSPSRIASSNTAGSLRRGR